jgi:hypothetical protein
MRHRDRIGIRFLGIVAFHCGVADAPRFVFRESVRR